MVTIATLKQQKFFSPIRPKWASVLIRSDPVLIRVHLWKVGYTQCCLVMRSEIPSGKCAKLRTLTASNNRDHALQSLFAYASHHVQSFTR